MIQEFTTKHFQSKTDPEKNNPKILTYMGQSGTEPEIRHSNALEGCYNDRGLEITPSGAQNNMKYNRLQ
ncbi:MAG: hypothetical protein K9N55_07290 [Phycisphaerae bacterium]|nr:hypothetical protein [Phycisphaerae bacterium]